ncbi:GAF domain-containing sensor histidine kinase [Streptomyces kaniharaensis]|uniref:histidine kinase n=1 Tax=Streptomyces kaniharaensis TaxID=212423 RepID=A0A6N7L519_9ACTN|nr:GAF domain-containing sensor histidine kinase [Streptomyces kaniharaensis]MQS17023.1 GAF domain-containing sensor histidine kinase [Streptomyces kaniharaensis]
MRTVSPVRRLHLAFGLPIALVGLTGVGILLGAVVPDRGGSRLPLVVAGVVAIVVSVAVSVAVMVRTAREVDEVVDRAETLRLACDERDRLDTVARSVGATIRNCADSAAVLDRAVEGLGSGLDASYVMIRLIEGDVAPVVRRWQAEDTPVGPAPGPDLPPVASQKLQELYDAGVSWYVDDFGELLADSVDPSDAQVATDLRDLPSRHLTALGELHAVAVLATPFGVGDTLLGSVTLIRSRTGQVWRSDEIRAAESVAAGLGPVLQLARLREAEERVTEELRSLDRVKEEFLSTVSHELRTPLSSISGYLELLMDEGEGRLSQRQVNMLEAMDRNATRLQSLIGDLLTLSQIESGAFTTTARCPVDLARLLDATITVIRPAADSVPVALEATHPPDPVVVDGDARQLQRALMNLLSNAVKFTPAGGAVGIDVTAENGQAVVNVSDNGIGIPPEEQKSLFTRFFRASNATELEIPGAGLGLSIVRTIVSNHSGDVRIRSQEGKGTSVTLRLPLLEPNRTREPSR